MCLVLHDGFLFMHVPFGTINVRGLFKVKANLVDEHLWYYLSLGWKNKDVHIFPSGMIGWLFGAIRISTFLGYFIPNQFLYK